MRRALAVLLFVLAAPAASAATVDGTLSVEGAIEFPPHSTLSSEPTAVFLQDAAEPFTLTMTSGSVHIRLFEETYAYVTIANQRPMIRTSGSHPEWRVSNAHVGIAPERPGWVGMYPREGVLTESTDARARIEPSPRAHIGNGEANPNADPSRAYYLVDTTTATLIRETRVWQYEGSAGLKIFGPTIQVDARENSSTIETGEIPDATDPTKITLRWLFIDSDAASIHQDGATTRVASPTLDAAWNGGVHLGRSRGTITSSLRTWTAEDSPGELEGDLTATIRPTEDGTKATMIILGELRASTFNSRANLPAPPGSANPWLLIGIATAVGMATVAGGAALIRHRPPRRVVHELGAEEYAQLAENAADAEDYATAAKWGRAARERSPTSRRLALDLAFYTAMSGQQARALRLLDEPLLSDDPDAHLLRARLFLESGRTDAAARAVAQALEHAPIVLLDVETDPTFSLLFARPDLRKAARDARRKLE